MRASGVCSLVEPKDMEKPQPPVPQEPTIDPLQSSLAVEQEMEGRRDQAFDKADDDELSFDVPRD